MSTPGTEAWAIANYGHPDRLKGEIVVIDFCGRKLSVNSLCKRHFLHLERIFDLYAPRYAKKIDEGQLDDWGYNKRKIAGTSTWSNHAFGIAIDINSLTNGWNTKGNMPEEVVRRAEASGFRWGGRYRTPDPMHFETLLTPTQISNRFDKEGRWK